MASAHAAVEKKLDVMESSQVNTDKKLDAMMATLEVTVHRLNSVERAQAATAKKVENTEFFTEQMANAGLYNTHANTIGELAAMQKACEGAELTVEQALRTPRNVLPTWMRI